MNSSEQASKKESIKVRKMIKWNEFGIEEINKKKLLKVIIVCSIVKLGLYNIVIIIHVSIRVYWPSPDFSK